MAGQRDRQTFGDSGVTAVVHGQQRVEACPVPWRVDLDSERDALLGVGHPLADELGTDRADEPRLLRRDLLRFGSRVDDRQPCGQQTELGPEAGEVAGIGITKHEHVLELGSGPGIALAVPVNDLLSGWDVAIRAPHLRLVPVPLDPPAARQMTEHVKRAKTGEGVDMQLCKHGAHAPTICRDAAQRFCAGRNDGSTSGQVGDDRSERINGVGADNEVGEAAVLPPPQDLLGGRRRVARKYQERVRRA